MDINNEQWKYYLFDEWVIVSGHKTSSIYFCFASFCPLRKFIIVYFFSFSWINETVFASFTTHFPFTKKTKAIKKMVLLNQLIRLAISLVEIQLIGIISDGNAISVWFPKQMCKESAHSKDDKTIKLYSKGCQNI